MAHSRRSQLLGGAYRSYCALRRLQHADLMTSECRGHIYHNSSTTHVRAYFHEDRSGIRLRGYSSGQACLVDEVGSSGRVQGDNRTELLKKLIESREREISALKIAMEARKCESQAVMLFNQRMKIEIGGLKDAVFGNKGHETEALRSALIAREQENVKLQELNKKLQEDIEFLRNAQIVEVNNNLIKSVHEKTEKAVSFNPLVEDDLENVVEPQVNSAKGILQKPVEPEKNVSKSDGIPESGQITPETSKKAIATAIAAATSYLENETIAALNRQNEDTKNAAAERNSASLNLKSTEGQDGSPRRDATDASIMDDAEICSARHSVMDEGGGAVRGVNRHFENNGGAASHSVGDAQQIHSVMGNGGDAGHSVMSYSGADKLDVLLDDRGAKEPITGHLESPPQGFSVCPQKPSTADLESAETSAVSVSLTDNGGPAKSCDLDSAHPWPEWTAFVDHLKKNSYFEDSEEGEITGAVMSFSTFHEKLVQSLSQEDLMVLGSFGCPSVDRKVVNSGKRLRTHLSLAESTVCQSCNLSNTCSRAYFQNTSAAVTAETGDVVRLLLHFGYDDVLRPAERRPLPKYVEKSIRNLLKQVVFLAENPQDSPASLKEGFEKKELQPGDWRCLRCKAINLSIHRHCHACGTLCGQDMLRPGEWKCIKCNLLNLSTNSLCDDCNAPRPPKELRWGDWECPKCEVINFARNKECYRCRAKQPPFRERQMIGFNKNAIQDTPPRPAGNITSLGVTPWLLTKEEKEAAVKKQSAEAQ